MYALIWIENGFQYEEFVIVGLYFITVALQHMLNLNAPVKSLAVAEPVWKVSCVNCYTLYCRVIYLIPYTYMFVHKRMSIYNIRRFICNLRSFKITFACTKVTYKILI